MARFVMFASLGSVILFLLTLVVPPSAQAQANALATPIPGSGHDYIHMAGCPSLWVPSRLKAAPPFVVFKGWVPRTLRAKPVHSPTNFEVPTLAKNEEANPTPEQVGGAVVAAQQAFKNTFGQAAFQDATTMPTPTLNSTHSLSQELDETVQRVEQ